MSVKSRGRDESLIICEMKQYIYTYYCSFLQWLALLSLIETSTPYHGVPHAHSVLLRHGLTYRSEKNFVWLICTEHVLAPKIISHGTAVDIWYHSLTRLGSCVQLIDFLLQNVHPSLTDFALEILRILRYLIFNYFFLGNLFNTWLRLKPRVSSFDREHLHRVPDLL